MALCLECADETLIKYSDRQQAPVSCKECGGYPAFWFGPQYGGGSLTLR